MNPTRIIAPALVAIALAGCGAASHTPAPRAGPPLSALPQAHPQAVDPAAGVQSAPGSAGATPIGDTSAHATPLSVVRRELKQMNLCGGTVDAADATPLTAAAGPGFVADPGTVQDVGELPVITADLNALGQALGVTIYGISGYRTPAQSVAVGGYADDPHTKGEAEDIGVNSLLRSSAAQISEAQLAQYGLYRPFDPSDNPDNTEVNHLQLIPSGGPLTLAEATAEYEPDPDCK